MLYNHRHWFPKEFDIKPDYSFAGGVGSAIYAMDVSVEHSMIFLGQEDGISRYNPVTKSPTTISGSRCTRLAYNESGSASYKALRVIILSSGNPVEYSYLPATNSWTGPIYISNYTRLVASRRGINDSLWRGGNSSDFSNYHFFRNIVGSTIFSDIFGSFYGIAAYSEAEMYMSIQSYYASPEFRFRKASAPTTDLSSPGTYLDKMLVTSDNTKIYGISGNYYSNFPGGNTLYIYNIAGNSWSTVTMPTNFLGYSIVYYNGNLFITGYDTVKAKGCIAKFDGSSSFEVIYSAYNEKLYCGAEYDSKLYLGSSGGRIMIYEE